jgi:hypothetical protein
LQENINYFLLNKKNSNSLEKFALQCDVIIEKKMKQKKIKKPVQQFIVSNDDNDYNDNNNDNNNKNDLQYVVNEINNKNNDLLIVKNDENDDKNNINSTKSNNEIINNQKVIGNINPLKENSDDSKSLRETIRIINNNNNNNNFLKKFILNNKLKKNINEKKIDEIRDDE